jgi:hypothetical protein
MSIDASFAKMKTRVSTLEGPDMLYMLQQAEEWEGSWFVLVGCEALRTVIDGDACDQVRVHAERLYCGLAL